MAPTHCPHCGHALPHESARGPSLASLLRPDTDPISPLPAPRVQAPLAASPEPQANIIDHGGTVPTASFEDTTEDAPALDRAEQAEPATQATQATALPEASTDEVALSPSAPEPAPAVPSFTRTRTRPPPRRVPAWQWGALVVLTLLLGLQLLIANASRLAQDARWRPALASMCGLLRCTLPTWHDPQAYTMLARDVRPVPGRAGVLQVRATFRNDAAWPQQWPSVGLSLSDADGRVAGARILVPDDYLDKDQQSTTLAPGQSGQLAVQVHEPREGVVAFAFDFQ